MSEEGFGEESDIWGKENHVEEKHLMRERLSALPRGYDLSSFPTVGPSHLLGSCWYVGCGDTTSGHPDCAPPFKTQDV